jgi:hypothetical protein
MKASMLDRITAALAEHLHKECDPPCPAEGMSRMLFDPEMNLEDVVIEDDNFVVIFRKPNDQLFQLTMTPQTWERRK